VKKTSFPWVLIGILVVGFAVGHVLGLILAVLGMAVVYLSSVRLNPRVRHGRCNGTGEHRSWLFPWVFRKCGRCASGRIIRFGARQWGSAAVKAEAARTNAALKAAREGDRWR
jgi:hypothetical protein